MPPTPSQRAGHALRVKAPKVAAAAVDALYRLRPEVEARYGEGGRRHCVKDLGHHLRVLAAAVELEDAKVFGDYAVWAAGVMVAHKVAPEDTVASFRALLEAAPAAVAPESAAPVRAIISAALERVEASGKLRAASPRSPRPRRSPAGPPVPSPSTAGSAPARS